MCSRRGGNAIDAGVAAGLASNVVQPDMCNFGGIASVLVRRAGDPTPYSVAGVGTWGASADRADDPRDVRRGPAAGRRALHRPGRTVGLDHGAGAVRHLELRRRRGAGRRAGHRRLPARHPHGARAWRSPAGTSPSGRAAARSTGRTAGHRGPGERLVQPALGRLLRDLAAAETGGTRADRLQAVHDHFYRGEVGPDAGRRSSRPDGGYLDTADLAGFRAEVAPAPSVSYGGWQVHVTPTWSQGMIVAQALGCLRSTDLKALGHNSSRLPPPGSSRP